MHADSVPIDVRPAVGAGQAVCSADELRPGQMLPVLADGRDVVVIRTPDGGLHGLEDRCLHCGRRLSHGRLHVAVTATDVGRYEEEQGRFVIKCSGDGYEYDVATGTTLFDSARSVTRVAVREADGAIFVGAPAA